MRTKRQREVAERIMPAERPAETIDPQKVAEAIGANTPKGMKTSLVLRGDRVLGARAVKLEAWKRAEVWSGVYRARNDWMRYGTPVGLRWRRERAADGSVALECLLEAWRASNGKRSERPKEGRGRRPAGKPRGTKSKGR